MCKFQSCCSLNSVTIGNGVTSIGTNAFYGCSGMTSVTIGNNVTSIGGNAFRECSGLTAVHISDIAAWCKIYDYPQSSAWNPEGVVGAQAGHGAPKGWNPCKGHSVYGINAEGATDNDLSPLRGCFSPSSLAGIPPLRGSMPCLCSHRPFGAFTRINADNHIKYHLAVGIPILSIMHTIFILEKRR
ncbi:MAG: leucine-rich repeat domain-containing protein [Prevotella sp.]|nr:leucine-rich repeat domain-containing protein [Prevotella sp.]